MTYKDIKALADLIGFDTEETLETLLNRGFALGCISGKEVGLAQIYWSIDFLAFTKVNFFL